MNRPALVSRAKRTGAPFDMPARIANAARGRRPRLWNAGRRLLKYRNSSLDQSPTTRTTKDPGTYLRRTRPPVFAAAVCSGVAAER
jgi:hypothetical protein